MAYFEVMTPDGVMQMSDERVFFSAVDSGSISNDGGEWGTSGVQGVYFRSLTISGMTEADNPMFSLTSSNVSTWAYLANSDSSSVTYHIFRDGHVDPGGTIEYWVFSTNSPPEPTSGAALVLQDASGRRVFSSDTPIARVLGILDENGYSGLSTSGRSLAHVPLKFGKSSQLWYRWGDFGSCSGGTSGGPGYQRYMRDGAAYILTNLTGSSPQKRQESYLTSYIALSCDPSRQNEIVYSHSTLGDWKTMILDVTHY